MKTTSACSVIAAFAFASLLTSCAFLQKGEFAQRKYYDFPRTKHSENQTAAVVKQDKAIPQIAVSQEENNTPAPMLSASVSKKEIMLSKAERNNPKKPLLKIENKISEKGQVESPAISFKKSEIKRLIKKNSDHFPSTDPDTMLIILIILAIFIPPLAVYLKDNETNKWFWITLLLCILGGGFIFGGIGYGFGLLWLIAVIIAIMDVLDKL